MYCAQCGKNNPAEARFCVSCGGALEPSGTEIPRPAAQVPAKKIPMALWLVPTVLVVIALSVVLGLFLGKKLRGEPEPVPAPTPGTQEIVIPAETPAEPTPAAPLDARVDFERITDNAMERARIRCYAADGTLLWERETENYACTELFRLSPIGIVDGKYLFVEGGMVTALDMADGHVRWQNLDFGGAGVGEKAALIDGTRVYLCGYYGPDFFAMDAATGETLARIGSLDDQFYWAWRLEKTDPETVAVYLCGGLDAGVVEEEIPIFVDTGDFSFRWYPISEKRAVEIASDFYGFREGDKDDRGRPLAVTLWWNETADNGRNCYFLVYSAWTGESWETLDQIYVDCQSGQIYDPWG